MAHLEKLFDADEHKKTSNVVPPGVYKLAITESEIVPTKKDGGLRCNLTLEILEGEMKNRKIFPGINIKNANPKAEAIGLEEFAEYCRACKKPKISDTEELHGIPFYATIGVRAETADFPAQNTVKKMKPADAVQGYQPPTASADVQAIDDESIPF